VMGQDETCWDKLDVMGQDETCWDKLDGMGQDETCWDKLDVMGQDETCWDKLGRVGTSSVSLLLFPCDVEAVPAVSKLWTLSCKIWNTHREG
jgi:hypothetical protein